MKRTGALLTAAAALAACATGGWARMGREFPEVRANCGLPEAWLERDARDPRLLHLTFPHRSGMLLQVQGDGRFGCVELWARERGYRLARFGEGERR